MNSKVIKTAASGLVIGAALVGCNPSTRTYRPAVASDKATPGMRQAGEAQQRAKKAVQQGDLAGAVAAMEQAVEFSPRDAGFRRTLADLYLKSGRFASAEATYRDVLALNPSDSKSAFFLTVSQLAQGRTGEAIAQLDAMEASIDPSDLGLAYALAGDTRRGIALLEPAARGFQASGRVRQNLALAYALAGDWKRARLTAEQDVSPADLNKRLEQWASLASAPSTNVRMAAMLGVSPAQDPGQPTRLALVPVQAETAALVQAEPVEAPAAIGEAAPAALAEAAPAAPLPEAVEAVAESASAEPAAPAPVFAQAPSDIGTLVREAIVPTAAPDYIRSQRPARASASGSSRYVVQIGAFGSAAQVERAWSVAQRRFAFGAGQEPMSTTVRINGKGLFHRLSVSGFDSQAAAVRTCRSIRVKGGTCFVRANAGDAPVQWASRSGRKTRG